MKFKVGDRVRVVADYQGNDKIVGKLGHHKCNFPNAKRGDAKCQV